MAGFETSGRIVTLSPPARMKTRSLLSVIALAAVCAAARPASANTNGAARTLMADLSDILSALEEHHVAVDTDAARAAAAEAVLRSVDPRARILSAGDAGHLASERDGRDYHVGLRLGMSNGWPVVAAVQEESPAAMAGITTGTAITAISRQPARDLTLPDAAERLRGHADDDVTLTLSGGAVTGDVSLTRSLLPLAAIEISEEFPHGIGYMKVNGLFPGSGRELGTILRGWSETHLSGAVIDLRGANGRDLESVAHAASPLADEGALLFTLQDLRGEEIAAHKAGAGNPVDMPVMVLVDARTRGAAEVLAVVLARSVRGVMVLGERTAGDPEVREIIDLPGERRALIATRALVTADGAVHDGRSGLAPDIEVKATASRGEDYEPNNEGDRRAVLEEERADRALRERTRGDRTLRRAVDLLIGLKALNMGRTGVPLPGESGSRSS